MRHERGESWREGIEIVLNLNLCFLCELLLKILIAEMMNDPAMPLLPGLRSEETEFKNYEFDHYF